MKQFLLGAGVALAAVALVASGMGLAEAVSGSSTTPPLPTAKGAGAVAHDQTRAALTPSPEEQIYSAVPTCRILDTRVHNKPVGTTAVAIQVSGATGFAAQGGATNGCGIPSSATSVNVSVTVGAETANGSLSLATPGATTRAGALYFAKNTWLSEGRTVPIVAGTGPGLTLKASAKTAVVIDVLGYYAPQLQAYVRLSVTPPYIYSDTSRILSVINPSIGQAVLVFDRTVEQCSTQVTPSSDGAYGSGYTVGNEAVVTLWYLDASTHAEVKANLDFNLTLTC